MGFDATTSVNFVFAALIFLLGLLDYYKREAKIALFIATAFFLFGITNLMSLLGISGLDWLVLTLRIVGYATIVFALYAIWSGSIKGAAPAPKAKTKRRR